MVMLKMFWEDSAKVLTDFQSSSVKTMDISPLIMQWEKTHSDPKLSKRQEVFSYEGSGHGV